jgi:ribosomal-protein-alanine N-acetyltransferase
MSRTGSLSDIELIQGRRIYLRLMQITDENAYSQLYGDDIQMQFVCPPLSREKSVRNLIRSIELNASEHRKQLYLSICENRSNKILGFCGLNKIDHLNNNIELGIMLCSNQTHKGFAEESLALLIGLCREIFPEFLISGILHRDNIAAQNLVKKVGYKLISDGMPWQLWAVSN